MHSYTIHRDGQNGGPYTTEQLRAGLADGTFLTTDLAWRPGLTGWTPIEQQLAIDAGERPSGPMRPQPSARTGPKKKHFSWTPLVFLTLFISIFFCWPAPFAVIAVFFAMKANSRESSGNSAGAAKARGIAKAFTLATSAMLVLTIAALAALAPKLIDQGQSIYAETLMQAQALELSNAAVDVMNDDLTSFATLEKVRAKSAPPLGWDTIVIEGEAIPFLSNEGDAIVLKKAGKFSLRSDKFKRAQAIKPELKTQSGPENEIEFFVETGLPVTK